MTVHFLILYTVLLLLAGITAGTVLRIRRTGRRLRKVEQRMNQLETEAGAARSQAYTSSLEQDLYIRFMTVKDALYQQFTAPHPRAVQDSEPALRFSGKQLNVVFSASDAGDLRQFFQRYRQYLDTYWKTGSGSWKTVFAADAQNGADSWGTVYAATKSLYQEAERLSELFVYSS